MKGFLSGHCLVRDNELVIDFNQFQSDGSAFTLIIKSDGVIEAQTSQYKEGIYQGELRIRISSLYNFLKERLK